MKGLVRLNPGYPLMLTGQVGFFRYWALHSTLLLICWLIPILPLTLCFVCNVPSTSNALQHQSPSASIFYCDTWHTLSYTIYLILQRICLVYITLFWHAI